MGGDQQEHVRDIIRQVLSREEFQEEKRADTGFLDPIRRFLERVWDRILEWLGRFLERISKLLDLQFPFLNGRAPGWVAVLMLAVLAVLAVVLAMVLVRIFRVRRKMSPGDTLAEELAAYTETPEEPFRLSEAYYRSGEYRMAFRYLFIALLVRMNACGALEIHVAKTNRSYRAELHRTDGALGDACDGFFDAFDLYWYGQREPSEADLDGWFARFDAVLAMTPAQAQARSQVQTQTRSRKPRGRKVHDA